MSIKTVADLKCPWFHARGTRVYDVKQEWQNGLCRYWKFLGTSLQSKFLCEKTDL